MGNNESGQKSSARRKNVLGPLSVGEEEGSCKVFRRNHGSLPQAAAAVLVCTGYGTSLGKQQRSVFSQNDEVSEQGGEE